MLFLAERCKLVVEGAGSVGVAALLEKAAEPRDNTVAILSGGNIDIHLLSEVIEHGLSLAGRFLSLTLKIPDRPGQLARALNAIAECRGNVLTIDHRRTGPDLPLYVVEVSLVLETRDAQHGDEIVAALEGLGLRPARRA
jgi:threonine dehydratase